MEYSYWWCKACRKQVDPTHVTFEERHEDCGYPVECITVKHRDQIAELQSQIAVLTADLEARIVETVDDGVLCDACLTALLREKVRLYAVRAEEFYRRKYD